MIHEIKTINPYFEQCWNQSKTFEVRLNDRNYNQGDTIIMSEYDAETDTYTGRKIEAYITYVLRDYYAIQKDHVVFSFAFVKYNNEK